MKELFAKIDAAASGKAFFLILGIILLCGMIFRVAYLDADPPAGITRSQDFSTDPFQYVYFAKNSVEVGNPNPYNDPRFTQWEKSSQNFLALAVFTLFGTGRAEGNAVAVIFNLASILLLALALRNFGARLAALIFALIASLDFTMVWFARTPFLEASQNFWLCATVFCFSLAERRLIYFALAGFTCAGAAFFGKTIALFMLGVFGLLALYQYLNEPEDRKAVIKRWLYFAGGFAVTTVIWFFYIYLPSRGEFSGYLSEQAFGLYGAPKALDSVAAFCWQLISLLWEQMYFLKQPLPTILAFFAGAGILALLARRAPGRRMLGQVHSGWLLLLLWFAVGYLSLFPWNYRPLRYQTTIMFPAFALAALALAAMIRFTPQPKAAPKKGQAPTVNLPQLIVTWALWLLPLIALIVLSFGGLPGNAIDKALQETTVPFLLAFVAIGAFAAFVYRATSDTFARLAPLGAALALAIVVFVAAWNVVSFIRWSGVRQYTLLAADRDLGTILSPGAVLSGSYATAFTQENRFGCVPHMFGVVRVDSAFFQRFPITHLAIDEGNEQRARQDYPEIMGQAAFVTRYFARGLNPGMPLPVRVYRVSGTTPNPEAHNYRPSDFEIAQEFTVAQQADSAEFYLRRFLDQHPDNYSANLYLGDALLQSGEFERAVGAYRQVQRFAPGDAVSALNIGNAFVSLGAAKTNAAFFDSALVWFKVAQRAFWRDDRIADMITQLERRNK